jgi:hypothetical protein
MKVLLGHDGPPVTFWTKNLITDEPLERCPVRTILLARDDPRSAIHEVERYVDFYYPAYVDGHLLSSGGIGDQPARYLEIINEVRSAEACVDRKMIEISNENRE